MDEWILEHAWIDRQMDKWINKKLDTKWLFGQINGEGIYGRIEGCTDAQEMDNCNGQKILWIDKCTYGLMAGLMNG